MWTVKSVSAEGTYYLVKGWGKNSKKRMFINDVPWGKWLFETEKSAKASLNKLLKVMGDLYANDKFEIIEVKEM